MSPESIQSLFALAIGFAISGCLASAYQVATSRPATFRLMQRGPTPKVFAAVPFLVFAAPFIIMRNTLRQHDAERNRFALVLTGTVLAGFWALMSGTVTISTLEAIGFLPA